MNRAFILGYWILSSTVKEMRWPAVFCAAGTNGPVGGLLPRVMEFGTPQSPFPFMYISTS
jgi:hypothetical protein